MLMEKPWEKQLVKELLCALVRPKKKKKKEAAIDIFGFNRLPRFLLLIVKNRREMDRDCLLVIGV